MKRFFDKENFLLTGFDGRQKRLSLVLALLIILAFIASSFTFFNMIYAFAEVVGAIVSGSEDVAFTDLLHTLPLFLSFFMVYWTLLALHQIFRNLDVEKTNKALFRKGIVILVLAAVNIGYVFIYFAVGGFLSLVEGGPSPLYPLNSVLYSLLFLAIGILFILYGKKFSKKVDLFPPSRGPVVRRARAVYNIFLVIWTLFALFGFAGSIYSIFIYDFVHGYAFYGIMVIFGYLLSACFLGFWEFYYNEMTEEKRKQLLLPLALVGLCVSVLVVTLYFVALATSLDAPSNAGFGMFPVAFAASVNIATILLIVTPLIVSIVALIKGLIARKHLG